MNTLYKQPNSRSVKPMTTPPLQSWEALIQRKHHMLLHRLYGAREVTNYCGRCGTPAEPSSAFCGDCGNKLATRESEEIS